MSWRKRMACNMGKLDRGIRAVLSVVFLLVAFTTDHLADIPILIWVGTAFVAVNIFAVTTGFCPMYIFTGHDTRSTAAKSK